MARLTDLTRHVGQVGLILWELNPFTSRSTARRTAQFVYPLQHRYLESSTPYYYASTIAHDTIHPRLPLEVPEQRIDSPNTWKPQARRIENGRIVRIRGSRRNSSDGHTSPGLRTSSRRSSRSRTNDVDRSIKFSAEAIHRLQLACYGRRMIDQQQANTKSLQEELVGFEQEAQAFRDQIKDLTAATDQGKSQQDRDRTLRHLRRELERVEFSVKRARHLVAFSARSAELGNQHLENLDVEAAQAAVESLLRRNIELDPALETGESHERLLGLSEQEEYEIQQLAESDGTALTGPQQAARKIKEVIDAARQAQDELDRHRGTYAERLDAFEMGEDPDLPNWNPAWTRSIFEAAFLRKHAWLANSLDKKEIRMIYWLEKAGFFGLEPQPWQVRGFYQPGDYDYPSSVIQQWIGGVDREAIQAWLVDETQADARGADMALDDPG